MIEDSIRYKLGFIAATLDMAAQAAEDGLVFLAPKTTREAEQMAEELLRMDIPDPRMEEVYQALKSREEQASRDAARMEERLEKEHRTGFTERWDEREGLDG
jgi:hypothetical protein